MVKDMVKASWYTTVIEYMKVNGKMTINMEKDTKCSPMGLSIKDNTSMENLKELVNINGLMDSSIKDNGSTVSNTDQECGKEPKATVMLVNGEWAKLKDTECMYGSMVIVIRDNLKTAWNTVKVPKNSPMEIYTKDNT